MNFYGINPGSLDRFQANGLEFEEQFIKAMDRGKYKDGKTSYRIQNQHGTKMDLYEGTDLIISAYTKTDTGNVWKKWCHIDPTLNFSEKKYMPYMYDTGIEIAPGHTLKMGIRNGVKYYDKNTGKHTYHNFEEPVIVLGTDIESKEYNLYEDTMIDSIEKNAREIIRVARKCIIDYKTTNKQKESTIKSPLIKNPMYVQPRKINKRYAEIQQIRDEIERNRGNNDVEIIRY